MGAIMKNEFPNGVWPVMLTPYTEDNKIDYPALEKLAEWYFEMTVTDCLRYASPAKCSS